MTPKKCEWCQNVFLPRTGKQETQKFCSNPCKAIAGWNNPERRARQSAKLKEAANSDTPFRRGLLKTATTNNCMLRADVREKVSKALSGKPFPTRRGGNGSGLTLAQDILLKDLGEPWMSEFVIWTRPHDNEWPIMIVDLALPSIKMAVECDGNSHGTRKAKARDAKKEALLTSIGWKLLRFKNQEILNSREYVLKEIHSLVSSRQNVEIANIEQLNDGDLLPDCLAKFTRTAN